MYIYIRMPSLDPWLALNSLSPRSSFFILFPFLTSGLFKDPSLGLHRFGSIFIFFASLRIV